MARIAKIKITADTGAFKQDIEKVKASIRGLGSVEVETKGISSLKKTLTEDLKETEKELKSTISSLKGALTDLAKASTLDSEEINKNLKALNIYYERLKDVQELMKKDSGAYKFFDALEGANPFGRMNRGLGAIAGAAGAVGLGLGVGTLFQRQRGISSERNAIAALVGGSVTEEQSQLGFTSEERRQRLLEVARASGRNLSVEEQNRALSLGESAERAYGITADQQGGFMGAARRAGVQDQQKAFAQAIGVATAAGLDGSKIGEYLSAMSDGITQMSQGINIDTNSLQGFAGVLSSLPFFANDPARAMRTAQELNQTFSQGDRFQQAMASRAIIAGSPGATPASIEFRRRMGLFGNLSQDALNFYGNTANGGSPELAKTLGLDGKDIVTNMFKDSTDPTRGLSLDRQLMEFADRLGMSAGAADSIFREIKSGKGISKESMEKIRKANMDPNERMKDTFNGFDAQVTRTGAKIEGAMDKMAKDITGAITFFDSKLGVSSDNLARFGEVVVGATTALTALTAASAMGALGKSAVLSGKLGKLGKGAAGAATGAIGAIGSRIGMAGAVVGGYELGNSLGNLAMESGGQDLLDRKTSKHVQGLGDMNVIERMLLNMGAVDNYTYSNLHKSRQMFKDGTIIDPKMVSQTDSALRNPSSPVMSMGSTDPDNTAAVQQNTEAINRFNEFLRQNSAKTYSNGSSRFPSEAEFLPSNTGVGKSR